jgi:hypothetical protein
MPKTNIHGSVPFLLAFVFVLGMPACNASHGGAGLDQSAAGNEASAGSDAGARPDRPAAGSGTAAGDRADGSAGRAKPHDGAGVGGAGAAGKGGAGKGDAGSKGGAGKGDAGSKGGAGKGEAGKSAGAGGKRGEAGGGGQSSTPSGKTCGGIAALKCPDAEFCDYASQAGGQGCGGQVADAAGTCQSKPNACPDRTAAVCGCDHRSYASECLAHKAGVSVLHDGYCTVSDCRAVGGRSVAGIGPPPMCASDERDYTSIINDDGSLAIEGMLCCVKK